MPRHVDLEPLGRAVRAHRQAQRLTLGEVAARSGLSSRFLSDLELGRGNISIARLVLVARSLGVPAAVLAGALDSPARPRPIALVGLRGAGKTTLGAALAARLGWSFIELDQDVETRAGLPLAQIFEIHGEAYYRRLEHELLRERLEENSERVLATGGGIVAHPESWAMLKDGARTVWLRATPEDHIRRVTAQGDLRPMKNRPSAKAELSTLLSSRVSAYEEADLVVDTSRNDVARSVELVLAELGIAPRSAVRKV